MALDQFEQRWDGKYPNISRSWRNNWQNVSTLFNYPEDIRKAIKKRKLFPHDDSAKKVIYLAIEQASKKWTMPIRNWKTALNRFMIEFEDRLKDVI
jgi:transposase-like protein